MAGLPIHKYSLSHKLRIAFTLIATTSVALACLGFLVNNYHQHRREILKQIESMSAVVAANSSASLAFADPVNASKTLSALSIEPQLRVACLYTSDGNPLASLRQNEGERCAPLNRAGTQSHFRNGELVVHRNIMVDDERLGQLVVHRRLDDVDQHMVGQLAIAGLVLLLATVVSLTLAIPLQNIITKPVFHLANIANRVTQDHEFHFRATKTSDDEFGHLTDAFNEMLMGIEERDNALAQHSATLEQAISDRTRELRNSNLSLQTTNLHLEEEMEERIRAEKEREVLHRRLLEASRQAGMAEVATGVLHNVGNVLNSVNVAIELLVVQLQGSKSVDLKRAMAIANQHRDRIAEYLTSDSQGSQLIPYLSGLGETLELERLETLEDLDKLKRNVAHIKEIVAMQQSYATSRGLTEAISPSEVIEDALRMNRAVLERKGIELVCRFGQLPAVQIDRHKTIQILINLIQNAQQALMESDQAMRRITISASISDDQTLHVEVADNGPGIEPAILMKIFNHGFTTKADGHGFGLHSCATAAQEMSGTLTVQSDGPERGATFTLELPTPLV